MKHSGATLLTLGLTYADDTVTIDYSDNGKGFDTAAVLDTGMGLSNITSRIQSLKGTVEITLSLIHIYLYTVLAGTAALAAFYFAVNAVLERKRRDV